MPEAVCGGGGAVDRRLMRGGGCRERALRHRKRDESERSGGGRLPLRVDRHLLQKGNLLLRPLRGPLSAERGRYRQLRTKRTNNAPTSKLIQYCEYNSKSYFQLKQPSGRD
ncbi:Hypothetical protein NTJ_05472 [Nesidiocoris tenuis]|uniref:Uncharacterized protein n=1 Tax=Nesidiocoris tenuis TaxID=355587 RepID=A0ABN7AL15_9HEMI|nr:Hypothetical protein NTJ_05472 [Nesidiocoris tenuis]